MTWLTQLQVLAFLHRGSTDQVWAVCRRHPDLQPQLGVPESRPFPGQGGASSLSSCTLSGQPTPSMWIFRAFWQVLPTAPPSCCHSKAAGTPPPRDPLVLAAWWLHRDPLHAQRTSTAQTMGVRLSLSSCPKDSPTWGKCGWSRSTGYPHWTACLFTQTWLCGACSPARQVPVGRVSLQLCSLAPWVQGHVPVIWASSRCC